ncbi:MAG: hypothetical protein H6822_10215 [Planctomycetaceae bacterium]|nr:hypothetical protein [Planctomycetales bacterium]MCB9922547.1 hypothetical protein [Planctomycetaceae bacterium]
MARKRVAPSKRGAPNEDKSQSQTSEESVTLKIDLHVLGAKERRRLEEMIEESLSNFGGRVMDRQTYSRGCYGRGMTTEVIFSNRSKAITAASSIYLRVGEYSDRFAYVRLSFYIDGERQELGDAERDTAGTSEMILVLVNKYFDEYREAGGKMGRRAFLERCIGWSGGVDRVYVEEGLTPSWQQLGAWYYENPS